PPPVVDAVVVFCVVVFCAVGLAAPPVSLIDVVSTLLFVFGGLPVPGGPPGGLPELLLEKPELCAFWSGLPPLPPPLPELLVASSSPLMRALSPPGGKRLGRPGGDPLLTITCEPGRVTFCVWPRPVTVMPLPKRKFAFVLRCVTPKMPMPPRMPIV